METCRGEGYSGSEIEFREQVGSQIGIWEPAGYPCPPLSDYTSMLNLSSVRVSGCL